MRPYISKILTHKSKTYLLPIPSKYRELLDCVQTLRIEDVADEDDIVLIGYASLIQPKPQITHSEHLVETTAELLSKLTPEQVAAVQQVCAAYSIGFDGLLYVLQFLNHAKGASRNENQE